jgi:hypothetical protein
VRLQRRWRCAAATQVLLGHRDSGVGGISVAVGGNGGCRALGAGRREEDDKYKGGDGQRGFGQEWNNAKTWGLGG